MKLNINTWAWLYLLSFTILCLVVLYTGNIWGALKLGTLPIHIVANTLIEEEDEDLVV